MIKDALDKEENKEYECAGSGDCAVYYELEAEWRVAGVVEEIVFFYKK